jgi:hypothetical protein
MPQRVDNLKISLVKSIQSVNPNQATHALVGPSLYRVDVYIQAARGISQGAEPPPPAPLVLTLLPRGVPLEKLMQ